MPDEPVQPTPAPPTATPTATPAVPVACCARNDQASRRDCALCGGPFCSACRRVVNGKLTCGRCADQILRELDAERAGAARIPAAIGMGVAAALVGGAVWALIGIMTNLEVGYVAIGVGWLAATSVVIGAGRKKGVPLQIISVACSVLGLVLGKYFLLVHLFKEFVAKKSGQAAADAISYFGSRTIHLFFDAMPKLLSVFDALWVLLALGIAWRIPKPTQVRVSMPRRG